MNLTCERGLLSHALIFIGLSLAPFILLNGAAVSLSAQEKNTPTISNKDKAAIVELTLREALLSENRIADYHVFKNKKEIPLSLENINLDLVPKLSDVPLLPLKVEALQARADHEGYLYFLRFVKFEVRDESVVVEIENRRIEGKDSNLVCLCGGGSEMEFRKEGEKWIAKRRIDWIS